MIHTSPLADVEFPDLSVTEYLLRKVDDNPDQAALIDGWVSSGEMREHTARVFLLGGRHYPIRLEFFKYKEDVSSIKLEWKPPHGVWEVVDDRHLVTAKTRRTFVVTTSFPADDRSLGYERGSSTSPEWQAAVPALIAREPGVAAAPTIVPPPAETPSERIARTE